MTSTNLPVQLTSFVGRRREIAEVERLLSASHLVTLTGASGCGKTRLALQVADSLGATFADGVWFVELAPLRDAALVPDLVAQALGVHPAANEPVVELLRSYLRPRRMLLVLDNCEHLSTACAELAQTLLSAAPNLTILATSREPLAMAGELLYQVSPLSLPPGVDWNRGQVAQSAALAPQDASGYEAIQLLSSAPEPSCPTLR